jgi:hypothetical protein
MISHAVAKTVHGYAFSVSNNANASRPPITHAIFKSKNSGGNNTETYRWSKKRLRNHLPKSLAFLAIGCHELTNRRPRGNTRDVGGGIAPSQSLGRWTDQSEGG